MSEPKLPGVTLRHRGSRRYQAGKTQKAELTLECEIDNESIWEEVERMLLAPSGFRIYTQEDFKGELVSVFQQEVKNLETDNGVLKYEKRRLEIENASLEEQLTKYKEIFDGFNKQFG
jgi:hypothetical protein